METPKRDLYEVHIKTPVGEVLRRTDISAHAKLCYFIAFEDSFMQDWTSFSLPHLAKAMSVTAEEAKKAILELEKAGLVELNFGSKNPNREFDKLLPQIAPYAKRRGFQSKMVFMLAGIAKTVLEREKIDDIYWDLRGDAFKVYKLRDGFMQFSEDQMLETLKELGVKSTNPLRDLIAIYGEMGIIEVEYWLAWINKNVVEMREEYSIQSALFGYGDPTPGRSGYVYLIKSLTSEEFYKIGKTKNPGDRTRTFNVKLPFDVEYLALIKAYDMHELEKVLHRRFARKRASGEWFKLDDEDIEFIQSLETEE